jgi:hypothetical protein
MTEQELNVLERIWKGETHWGTEWEETLNSLAATGYIELLEKREASHSSEEGADEFFVKVTDEGSAHLSGNGY